MIIILFAVWFAAMLVGIVIYVSEHYNYTKEYLIKYYLLDNKLRRKNDAKWPNRVRTIV